MGLSSTMPDFDYRLAYEGEPVVVTGGAGAIGSNLVRTLLNSGARVIVLDDLSAGHLENLQPHPNLRFLRMDITSRSELKRLIHALKPSYLFHLAAHYANLRSVAEPARNLTVNTLAVVDLLECCLSLTLKRFLLASSSCVYDHQAPLPIGEESPKAGSTPYGISKATAEDYCAFYREYYGLPITILRYFNSYGPGDYPGAYRGVIPNMLARSVAGEPIIITGTGQETRDFTYVTDLVDGTLRAGFIHEAAGETLNLASGRETSINELAGKILALSGSTSKISYLPRRSWDQVTRRVASIAKAQKILGYQPRVQLDEGLSLTYSWSHANWQKGQK